MSAVSPPEPGTTVDVAHPRNGTGQAEPELKTRVPGPESHSWLLRMATVAAPMGPRQKSLKFPNGRERAAPPRGVVLSRGFGCNVWDPDDNRFVDLAAGFGSLLMGHSSPQVRRGVELQGDRLVQGLGDVYPADAKIGLMQQLARLFPEAGAQVILGLSGADAVTAALKTALLHSSKPGVLAFNGAYHGLGYAPLAACGLRASYREPFAEQLGSHVEFMPYPDGAQPELGLIERQLASGRFGALLVEPILGRGGIRPLAPATLARLRELTHQHDCLLVVDEIWTGLGRSGAWLYSAEAGICPDLVCLGKGLGGGLPISACLGPSRIMRSWSREQEVVHTSTFSGAPLSCATALACLDVLRRHRLVARSQQLGEWFIERLRSELKNVPVEVRGAGLMLGVDLGDRPGAAGKLMYELLSKGYMTSTGGGQRETLVLTPPLNIEQSLLESFTGVLRRTLREL